MLKDICSQIRNRTTKGQNLDMDSNRPIEKKSTKNLEFRIQKKESGAWVSYLLKVCSWFLTRIERSSLGHLRVKDILHFKQIGDEMPSVVLDLEVRVNWKIIPARIRLHQTLKGEKGRIFKKFIIHCWKYRFWN